MVIRACFGSKCSQVRILLPRRWKFFLSNLMRVSIQPHSVGVITTNMLSLKATSITCLSLVRLQPTPLGQQLSGYSNRKLQVRILFAQHGNANWYAMDSKSIFRNRVLSRPNVIASVWASLGEAIRKNLIHNSNKARKTVDTELLRYLFQIT